MNPNTEEQIVQAMVGVLAYNLAENDENIKFDYNSNSYQNSHEEIGVELEMQYKKLLKNLIKSLDILIKSLYNEYNSSRYLISAIIKM